ncbi:MAG: TrbG/VirB9 family P-type conjugative transfer protein [Asticcacaulis sp.]
MSRFAVSFLALSLAAGLAHAQPDPDADSRLKTVDYDEAAVVQLTGCVKFQTMITFADDEHVENVGIGDSNAWQVMPNKRGNLLFVKPLTAGGFSNMTVVTDKHDYNFELRPGQRRRLRGGPRHL